MRMLSLISLMVLATTVFSLSGHAEPPAAPTVAQLTPQIRSMLEELLKNADLDPELAGAGNAPAVDHSGSPALPARKSSSSLQSSSLRTGSLSTGGLGNPRMSDAEWRQQFPVRR